MRHYEAQAEVRKHYFLEEYVAIAPKRTHSLHHESYPKAGELKEPPLEDEPSVLEIPAEDGKWAVKVIRNIYPAFSVGNKKAYGAQEVILETNPTDIPFSQLPVEQILRVFEAFQKRVDALQKLKDVKYVSVFHNDGLEAGASVKQTHSQIIAIGTVPPRLKYRADAIKKLTKRYGASPLSRAMAWEDSKNERIIYSDKYITTVAPYASEHPYEVWLVPKRQASSVADLKPKELEIMAKCLKAVTSTLQSEKMSFNFHLIEAVKGYPNHFCIKVTPRPNVWAGFELNTEIPINPVAPEDAAKWYRNFIQTHNAL